LLDQVQWLDAAAGLDLVARVVARSHPWTWELDDDRLDRWPAPVAAFAVEVVRALPPGAARLEALCRIGRRLEPAEQEEVLQGIVDGSLLEKSDDYDHFTSRRAVFVAFVRTLPPEGREVWVRARAARDPKHSIREAFEARRDVDALTETALRDLWERIPPSSDGTLPSDFIRLAACLPPDLRAAALATIRACPDPWSRIFHLATFDADLTDDERREVVEAPGNLGVREDPRSQSLHLRWVARHLPKVAPAVRRAWLDSVLDNPSLYDRLIGLIQLLPSLSGEEKDEAEAALLAALEQQNGFAAEERWDLVPEDALAGLLLRLRDDPYAWHRDGLIAHVCTKRPAETMDRVFPLLLEGLRERAADTCLEIVRALGPWLADRTAGAVPRALAGLDVPASDLYPSPDYMITRVIRDG
jgi:hypothetical protein